MNTYCIECDKDMSHWKQLDFEKKGIICDDCILSKVLKLEGRMPRFIARRGKR